MTPTRSDGERRLERDGSTLTSPRPASGLQQREATRNRTICVVGLGYVGLPLAVTFGKASFPVIGYDIDEEKIGTLRRGSDPPGDLSEADLRDIDIAFTSDPGAIGAADVVIVTVPTPVDEHDQPNLEFVESAARTVGEQLSTDTTVILESTVYPGATHDVFIPALETASDLTSPDSFGVGYSPERISPGTNGRSLDEVVKIVSGQTEQIRAEITELYEEIIEAGVYRAPSIEVAEAAKVVENVQRDLNIAFVNELAMALERMDVGVDTHDVLEAAGTKWNFHDYRPGLVGGHCIPVDPYFLSQCSKQAGFVPELMLRGRQVNETVPDHVAEVTIKALNENDKTLRSSTVLLLGLTYKANVPDVRTSKVGAVAEHLRRYQVDVMGYDPVADPAEMQDAFGFDLQDSLSFNGVDAAILATPHDDFTDLDPASMAAAMAADPLLVDVSGRLDAATIEDAGIAYRRL